MWMYIDMASNNKTHNTKIGSKVMKKCSICKNKIYTEHGHNAEPVNNGTCCEMCNQTVVIPFRIKQMFQVNNG